MEELREISVSSSVSAKLCQWNDSRNCKAFQSLAAESLNLKKKKRFLTKYFKNQEAFKTLNKNDERDCLPISV